MHQGDAPAGNRCYVITHGEFAQMRANREKPCGGAFEAPPVGWGHRKDRLLPGPPKLHFHEGDQPATLYNYVYFAAMSAKSPIENSVAAQKV